MNVVIPGSRRARVSRFRRVAQRLGSWTVATGAAAVAVLAVGASVSFEASSPAVKETCERVGAVLSDGPDRGADPVGYAEAQILPLRQIHTSDRPLQTALEKLSAAYEAFYRADGRASSLEHAVTLASRDVDAICPGATS